MTWSELVESVGSAWPLFLTIVVVPLAGALLFTPAEAVFECVMAVAMVTAVLIGFLIHPRRDVFYVRTAVPIIDADRNKFLEHDLLAVRVEIVRLWLLFIPTVLAVASLVFFATGGSTKFSFLNWIISSWFAPIAVVFAQFPVMLVLCLIGTWIGERRVLRNAEACSARSYSVSRTPSGWSGWISYLFMGEHGEYYGGDGFYLRLALEEPDGLATIVFHDIQNPELNKIAMGFLFHRVVVLGRGVTDIQKEAPEAQAILATQLPPGG
jgi:hypothetical protein